MQTSPAVLTTLEVLARRTTGAGVQGGPKGKSDGGQEDLTSRHFSALACAYTWAQPKPRMSALARIQS
jgi:hypothetical protein